MQADEKPEKKKLKKMRIKRERREGIRMSVLKKRTIAIIGGALAIVVATGSVASIYAKAAVKVNSQTIAKADMSQVLELNGTVASNETQVAFADTNLKVSKVYFKVGDEVKKGDLLVSFDETEIDNAIELLNLEAAAKEGGYQNALQVSDKYNALYSEATRNLKVLNQQIADTEEAIINKQKEINQRSSDLAGEGARLQMSIIDWSDEPESDELANLRKQAQNNAYVQSYDSELLRLQEELVRLNNQLAGFKEYKSEMTSQKASSALGVITEGGKAQLDAEKEAGEINTANQIAKLEEAKKGIKAEFNGVISSVNVEEGSLVCAGTPVISVDSLENVCVKCNANKYDIISIEKGQSVNVKILNKDYTGEVTRMEKITGTDAAGVGVDVKLDSTEDVILGLDVKAKVSTASLTGVISVPNEAVVTENEKSYVFVSRDKKAVKVNVETGIKNDDSVEIVSGLKEGDIIVWSDAKELSDGEDVRF